MDTEGSHSALAPTAVRTCKTSLIGLLIRSSLRQSRKGPSTAPSPRARAGSGIAVAEGTTLHRERAPTPTCALGTRIVDAEAAPVQIIVEIHHHVAQVHEAALVHHDRNAVEIEHFVQLLVNGGIQIELVLE